MPFHINFITNDIDYHKFIVNLMDIKSYGIFWGECFVIKFIHSFFFPSVDIHLKYEFNGIIIILIQDGMGQLKVIPGGLQLSGQTLVLDVLRASNIRSRLGQPIVIGNDT
jgi:hypothetical protein